MARPRETSSIIPAEFADAIRPWHEEIAIRAYALYQRRDAREGSDFDDWLEAERQLLHERSGKLAVV